MNTTGNILVNQTSGAVPLNNPASQPASSEMTGLFQKLVKGELSGESGNTGWNELLELLAGINGEQMAELIAMLGLNPYPYPTHLLLNGSSASAVGVQTFRQTGSGNPQAIKEQLGKAIMELFQKADLTLQEALKTVKESAAKQGIPSGGALLELIESVSQQDPKASISVSSGALTFSVEPKGYRKSDALLFIQGSQIRPELAAISEGPAQIEKPVGSGVFEEQAATQGINETKAPTPILEHSAQQPSAVGPGSMASPMVSPTIGGANQGSAEGARTVYLQIRPDQFQSDFPAALIKHASLIERGGMSEMRMTLVPEGLGEIQVRIQGEGGHVALQISADSQYARALLDSGIGALKLQLESQGVQVNRVEVVPSSFTGSSVSEQGMFDGQQQQRDTHTRNQQKQHQPESDFTLDEFMDQENLRMANGEFEAIA
ncbi:flagellar hook-length control protein FliK [Effusibacillus consociatus]|uniref:Flagellar hook-length control protein FliK n=1 Tax=Effusibacillus consociatus TaxID=1117041 RepID=A0ABV9Q4S1_9BACL